MNTTNIDWRLVFVIIFVLVIIFSSPYANTPTNVVVAAIGAGWLIQSGLAPWRTGRGGMLGSSKVTYWRGQRIVTKQPARARVRAVSSVQMLVSVFYLALGLGLAAAALLKFVRMVNLGL